MSLRLRVIDPPTIAEIVMRCASDEFEVRAAAGITEVTCLTHQGLISH
jgi:hypothetical protein